MSRFASESLERNDWTTVEQLCAELADWNGSPGATPDETGADRDTGRDPDDPVERRR